MDGWLYLASCLVLPVVWGWLAHWLFKQLRVRRYLPAPVEPSPTPVEKPTDVWYPNI